MFVWLRLAGRQRLVTSTSHLLIYFGEITLGNSHRPRIASNYFLQGNLPFGIHNKISGAELKLVVEALEPGVLRELLYRNAPLFAGTEIDRISPVGHGRQAVRFP